MGPFRHLSCRIAGGGRGPVDAYTRHLLLEGFGEFGIAEVLHGDRITARPSKRGRLREGQFEKYSEFFGEPQLDFVFAPK